MRSVRPIFTAILELLVADTRLATMVNLRAQGNGVTLLLSVPTFGSDLFTPKLLGDFESTHPGIKIQLVKPVAEIPQPALGLDKHFEAVEKYASSGDVLYVASGDMSAEATRAGYFLDLAPLANEDKSLNADDFYPTIWQSFQWDKGIWAMPFGADAYVLTYSPPLRVGPAVSVALQSAQGEKRAGALLPGGKGALSVQAFAVSGGTQHPEQAYALAQWLTTRGEVANNGFSSSPARKSLLGGPTSDQVVFKINVTPEIQALIDNAIANAVPNSEMRFVDYLAV